MRHRRTASIVLAVALSLLGVAGLTRRAHAQLDPGMNVAYAVYQNGVMVGEIFREDNDPRSYTEHWVLYPGYVYPSGANGVVTSIRASDRLYNNLEDFFARVPWSRGSRHVEAACADGMALPFAR
jgi:hypothetical protein